MNLFYFMILIAMAIWDLRQLWGNKREIALYLGFTAIAILGGVMVYRMPPSFGIVG